MLIIVFSSSFYYWSSIFPNSYIRLTNQKYTSSAKEFLQRHYNKYDCNILKSLPIPTTPSIKMTVFQFTSEWSGL